MRFILYSHLCLVLPVGCPTKVLYSLLCYPILPHSSFTSTSLISSPYFHCYMKNVFVCLYCIIGMTNGKHDPNFVGKLIRRDTTCSILGGRIVWKRNLRRETGFDKCARDLCGHGWGTADRDRQWLRCCATKRKVAGSIPAGVFRFFIDIKSFRSHCGPWGRLSL